MNPGTGFFEMTIINLNDQENNLSLKNYDVIIIGSGPAGISAALELSNSKKRIAVLEAGGEKYSEFSQNFYEGTAEGDKYFPLSASRLRMFGGSSNHWGGWCRELDEIDFKKKQESDLFEWPINKKDLDPFLGKAQDILDLKYITKKKKLNKNLNQLTWDWSSVRFGDKYRKFFLERKHIDLYLNANIQNFIFDKKVTGLNVRNSNGSNYLFVSKIYALATGGIENSRLLLYSNVLAKQQFIKNKDSLGKYWMEHPHINVGGAFIDRQAFFRSSHNSHPKNQSYAFISPTSSYIGNSKLSCCLRFKLYEKGKESQSISEGTKKWIKESMEDLACLDSDFTLKIAGREFKCYSSIKAVFEQPPRYANRIELDPSSKDIFGVPKIKLYWKQSLDLKETIIEVLKETGIFFKERDIGRLYIDNWLLEKSEPFPEHGELAGYHHMGGTRMSKDRNLGIVDKNLSLFDHNNIFVLGSSVFPSSGHANPTLTIVQLSLRWAKYIKDSFWK